MRRENHIKAEKRAALKLITVLDNMIDYWLKSEEVMSDLHAKIFQLKVKTLHRSLRNILVDKHNLQLRRRRRWGH